MAGTSAASNSQHSFVTDEDLHALKLATLAGDCTPLQYL